MKEKMESMTPLQMDEMEKGRLSLEEAQELANLMVTKLDGFDFKKLEPEDYERAMNEIEKIKRWAERKETKIDDLIEILKNSPILGTLGALGYTGLVQIAKNTWQTEHSMLILFSLIMGYITAGVFMNPKIQLKYLRKVANKELSELQKKTEQRLEAEKKYSQG